MENTHGVDDDDDDDDDDDSDVKIFVCCYR